MKRLLKWLKRLLLVLLSPLLFYLFLLPLELLLCSIIALIVLVVMGITALRIGGRIFRRLGITPDSTDAFLNRLRSMVRLMRRRRVSLARMRVVVLCYAIKLGVIGPRPKARLRSR